MRCNHQKTTTLICLLDKAHPPDHSFVKGMLAQAMPSALPVRVLLVVASRPARAEVPQRYHGSVSVPALPALPRRGVDRVRLLVKASLIVNKLVRRARARGERVVLFVRNDPLQLLVARRMRSKVDGLIFQNSFPLEESHGSGLQKRLHRWFYRLGTARIDGVLAVSPLGLERVQKLCPRGVQGGVVPLLSDLPMAESPVHFNGGPTTGEAVHFIYAGTHRQRRRMDVVLRGVVGALESGVNATFTFIGGSAAEFDSLRQLDGVTKWEEARKIRFLAAVERPKLPERLAEANVGLSLIPESPEYREASPTKLAEYMGAGLAVLASEGVELQEQFVRESGGGVLVPFSADAIAEGIQRLASDSEYLHACKQRSSLYAQQKLQYTHYLPVLEAMIGSGSPEDRGMRCGASASTARHAGRQD